MKINPLPITSKTGKKILIREAKLTDSSSLIECVKSYLNCDQIPLTREEFEEMAVNHTDWIRKFLDGKNDLLLVAEHQGEIIANIDLTVSSRKMLSHVGYIGMGVHEDWQGQGIGTCLLQHILAWVDQNRALDAVWLQVYANNTAGIKLYSKLGFETTGTQRNFIKTLSGQYIDNIIMTRYKYQTKD